MVAGNVRPKPSLIDFYRSTCRRQPIGDAPLGGGNDRRPQFRQRGQLLLDAEALFVCQQAQVIFTFDRSERGQSRCAARQAYNDDDIG